MGIGERYLRVAAEAADIARQAGRNPADIRVIAVSKTVGPAEVGDAMNAACRDFGENRPDDLLAKYAVYPLATWHFIGNIQSRRIDDIALCATYVHSLYQLKHAQKLSRCCEELGKTMRVLVEVNVSGEASKSGLAPDDVAGFIDECLSLPALHVEGLMTMAPQGDPVVAQECFAGLAQLKRSIALQLPADRAEAFTQLSMGMSEDWREAILEGATMIRVGRAIFSPDF